MTQQSSTTTTLPIDVAKDAAQSLERAAWAMLAVLVVVVIIVLLFIWALLRAGTLPTPLALTMALALLGLVALAGFIATDKEGLGTISATAIGALASAVSTQFEHRRNGKE